MPSFSIEPGSGLKARVTYSVKQNISSNTSTITFTSLEVMSNGFYGSSYWTGTVSIGSHVIANLAVSSLSASGAQMIVGQYVTVGNVSGSSCTVTHSSDGTKSVTASVSLAGVSAATSNRFGSISGSVSIALPTIPRASTISAGAVALGSAMAIKLSKASSGFTDTVTYTCGSASGTIVTKSGASSISWTPPLELARQAPSGTSVTVKLTSTTYSGSTSVGTSTVSVKCTLPSSIAPSISSVTLSDKRGLTGTYGGYVQNQSVLRVVTAAAGSYSSSISSVSVTCGNLSGSGADASFSLPGSGTTAVNVTVTDSRGRKASWSGSVSVLPYRAPTVSVSAAYRCDSSGNAQPDGTGGRVKFSAAVTSLSGKNTARYTLRYRQRGTSTWSTASLSAYENQLSPSAADGMFTADIDKAYEVRVTAADNFTTVESGTVTLPVAFALLDFDAAAKAIGLGQRANTASAVSFGLDAKMLGHRVTDLGTPTQSTDAATKGYADSLNSAMKTYVDGQTNKLPGLGYSNSATVSDGTKSIKTATWTNCGSWKFDSGYHYFGFFILRFDASATGYRVACLSETSGSNSAVAMTNYSAVAAHGGYGYVTIPVSLPGDGKTYYLNAYQNSGSNRTVLYRFCYIRIPK